MTYLQKVLEDLKVKNAEQPEFIQAATEVLTSLEPVIAKHPEYEKAALLERLVETERTIVEENKPLTDDELRTDMLNDGWTEQEVADFFAMYAA